MKKYISILILASFIPVVILAQNEDDAIRYSQNYYGGTARSISMAGAFGALGGDFSSLSMNPAGIGAYRSTEFTITPTYLFNGTSTDFINTTSEDDKDKFILNNISFITTHMTGDEDGLISVSFGIGYNRLNNYYSNTTIVGRQPAVIPPVSPLKPDVGVRSSSMLDNFTNVANGEYSDLGWSDKYEGIADLAYLLPFDDSIGEYWNDINEFGYGQLQRRWVSEWGHLGEYAFSIGANYSNTLYFGATFGIHRLRFGKSFNHFEWDDQERTDFISGENFISFNFTEHIETFGTGYTFKLGLIYRPISMIRLGAAFHIPTFYRNREEFYTTAESLYDIENEGPASAYEESDHDISRYWLRTPYKAIGSAAIQIPKIGFVSVDYEFIDYTIAKLEDNYGPFYDVNQEIRSGLKAASNIRTGAEVRFGNMYLRGGFAFYGSPYAESHINHDADTYVYTGGLGFRFENIFFDIGYSHKENSHTYYMYREEDFGAYITNKQNLFVTTLGFRF